MSHVAVVLAAGGSRRLGRPKQLLTTDGETLVRRAARLAIESGAARTLVIVGADGDAVEAALAGLAVEIVANAEWMRGLGASLACAGRALGPLPAQTKVLVVGCDQPRLAALHLQRLVAAAHDRGRLVVATGYADTVGIPAIVPPAWFATVAAGVDDGFGARLRTLPAAARAVVPAAELGDDLDTPAELAAAIAAGWIDPD